MDFVNLYVQSEYSMLNSTIKLSELMEFAKNNNLHTLAICDNNMSGVLKFYKQCLRNAIKPIIGLRVMGESSNGLSNTFLLYAKDNIGYRNLLKISSHQEVTKDKVPLEYLIQHSEGLIVVLPSEEHELFSLILAKDYTNTHTMVDLYKRSFEELYLGLNMQFPQSINYALEIVDYAADNNLKVTALHKTNYLYEDDFEAYLMLRSIDLGENYSFSLQEANSFFPTPNYVLELFKEYPLLLNSSKDIASKCHVVLEFGQFKMPKYDLPAKDVPGYLSQLCKVGLNKRLKGQRNIDLDVYRNRLLYELDIIHKMQFEDYFLIVYDFVKYAKNNNILVGPGRGSAPGSLISYSLGITEVDPIKHHLLFERFLNPERITMPDIDLDFPDSKRDQVIQYVGTRYGKNKVAHISTFGTYGARMSIRDVARIMKINEHLLNEILKQFPAHENKLSAILQSSPILQQMVTENKEVEKLFKLAMRIEGLPKHVSTHAAGIIITDFDLVNYTALREGMNGLFQTQFEASDLEDLGLVKIDFLGLKNLSIIEDVVEQIQKHENLEINLSKIPLDDQKTYQLIASGQTNGIFQLESSGMKNVLYKLKTSSFIDIVHANALFRPGPKEMIDHFVRRKFGQERLEYLHPDLAPILSSTYGIIVFQEQIMLIAQKFAGYTLGMADILRRGISKKDANVLSKERTRFVQSAAKRGYSEAVGNEIYDYIVKFADYGFNKNHAVAYSVISYQMAYLKTHYYKYFMAVLLQNSLGSNSAINGYINECRKNSVDILLPSINESENNFKVSKNGIYYPLIGVLGINFVVGQALISERLKEGFFKDYDDFVNRTRNILTTRLFENLVYSGALDEFGLTRKQMVEDYDNTLQKTNYQGLFDEQLIPTMKKEEEYSFEIISSREKEVLGLNLKYNMFLYFEDYKLKHKIINLSDLKINTYSKVLVMVRKITIIKTKKGDEMAFLDAYDDFETIDVVVFPKVFIRVKSQLTEGSLYVLEGKCEVRNDKKQFILENVYMLK